MADPTPTQIAQQIVTDGSGPRRVAGDTGSAEGHSLTDRIKAEQFAASTAAFNSNTGGIRRIGMRPGHPSGLRVGCYFGGPRGWPW